MNEAIIAQIKQDFKTEFPDEGKVIYLGGYGKPSATKTKEDLRCLAYTKTIKRLELSNREYSITEARGLVDETFLSLINDYKNIMTLEDEDLMEEYKNDRHIYEITIPEGE